MDERGQQEDPQAEEYALDRDEEPLESGKTIRTHESRPGRFVFTEDGNTDGWIATDLAVEPEP